MLNGWKRYLCYVRSTIRMQHKATMYRFNLLNNEKLKVLKWLLGVYHYEDKVSSQFVK
ncbi:hypothetical protein JPSP19_04860 [Staphylococcus pseudintermedius]